MIAARSARAVPVLFALAAAACAADPARSAAQRQDFEALRRELSPRHEVGKVGSREARRLAEATVEAALLRGTAAEQLSAIAAVGGCVEGARDPLETLAEGDDDVAATAGLLLVEAGFRVRAGLSQKMYDARDLPRALATRVAADADLRRARFLDPSGDVRLAAFRAAAEATDRADAAALREAVQKEPLPLARTTALRALAAVERAHPDEASKTVLLLRELLARAVDVPVAEDAYALLAQAPWREAGGDETLLRALAGTPSPATVAGAIALLRAGGAGRERAVAHLARALEDGTEREQRFVFAAARPLPEELLPATKRIAGFTAAGDGAAVASRPLAVAALDALADRPVEGARARALLVAFAAPNGADPAARAARLALARRGDRGVQAWIEQDLRASDRAGRLGAAQALAALGVQNRVAPLLADSDGAVRLGAACAILRR